MAKGIDIAQLKSRGLTCSRLKSMERKQGVDAKRDKKDAILFRGLGFVKQAETQEKIAQAQENSAKAIKSLREKVCLLK